MFESVIGEWIKPAQKKYEQLDQAFKDADKQYIHICELFGEDSKTCQPSDFFGKISQFVTMCNTARQENEEAVQKMAELEKKERLRNEKNQTIKKQPAKNSEKTEHGQKDGELDDLISSIKTGKAFFQQGFAPQKRQRHKGNSFSKESETTQVDDKKKEAETRKTNRLSKLRKASSHDKSSNAL